MENLKLSHFRKKNCVLVNNAHFTCCDFLKIRLKTQIQITERYKCVKNLTTLMVHRKKKLFEISEVLISLVLGGDLRVVKDAEMMSKKHVC